MLNVILRVLIIALSLFVAEWLVPGIFIDDLYTALIVAVILGLLNVVVRPVLVVLTLPINILTLGLFIFFINAALFWFVASFVDGFIVDDFISAFVGALVVSVVSTIGNKLLT